MKAITLYQPWASLIAIGAKKFETRSWDTSYRGPLAIHAGMKNPQNTLTGVDTDIIKAMGAAFGYDTSRGALDVVKFLETLPRGAIICVTELAGCFKMWDGARAGQHGSVCIDRPNQYWSPNWQVITEEFMFGDWRPGRFAWELSNIEKLEEPIPIKGRQGLWEWYAGDSLI